MPRIPDPLERFERRDAPGVERRGTLYVGDRRVVRALRLRGEDVHAQSDGRRIAHGRAGGVNQIASLVGPVRNDRQLDCERVHEVRGQRVCVAAQSRTLLDGARDFKRTGKGRVDGRQRVPGLRDLRPSRIEPPEPLFEAEDAARSCVIIVEEGESVLDGEAVAQIDPAVQHDPRT